MRCTLWILLALLTAAPLRAHAASFGWDFVATPITPGAGNPLYGRLTFDSNVPDLDPDTAFGAYEGAVIGFDLYTSHPFGGPPLPALGSAFPSQISIDRSGVLGVHFFAAIWDLAPEAIPTWDSGSVSLELVDSSGTLFASDAIPEVPPSLALLDPYSALQAESLGFTTRVSVFLNDEQDPGASLVYDLELVVLEIPEPPGAALVAIGLGALACTRRRRSNRAL